MILPLGFAHLLQNHLLGGLRGDASQRVGGLGNADFAADFSDGIDDARASSSEISLAGSVTGSTTLLHAENFERAGLLIDIRDQVFVGAEMLARRHQHGVLDRIEHDLRIDALFLA